MASSEISIKFLEVVEDCGVKNYIFYYGTGFYYFYINFYDGSRFISKDFHTHDEAQAALDKVKNKKEVSL